MVKKTKKKKTARSRTRKTAKKTTTKKKTSRSAKKPLKKPAAKSPRRTVKKTTRKLAAPTPAPAPVVTPAPRPTVTPPPAPLAPPTPAEEKVGVVTHYYGHLGVAVVRLERGHLRVGETIHVKGHTSDFRQKVESIEIEHQRVPMATVGQEFGLLVTSHAREGDEVYKVPG